MMGKCNKHYILKVGQVLGHHSYKEREISSWKGGVTPIDSIVTAAIAGQNFDRLFSAFDR